MVSVGTSHGPCRRWREAAAGGRWRVIKCCVVDPATGAFGVAGTGGWKPSLGLKDRTRRVREEARVCRGDPGVGPGSRRARNRERGSSRHNASARLRGEAPFSCPRRLPPKRVGSTGCSQTAWGTMSNSRVGGISGDASQERRGSSVTVLFPCRCVSPASLTSDLAQPEGTARTTEAGGSVSFTL